MPRLLPQLKTHRPPTPLPRKNSPLSDPAQRDAGLYEVKLKGLVRQHVGALAEEVKVTHFSGGAGLVADAVGWTYFHDSAVQGSALGAALVWGTAAKAGKLNVIVDDLAAGAPLARQASAFSLSIDVWASVGTTLEPVPCPAVPLHSPVAAAVENYRSVFVEAGAEVTRDGDDLVAEILGLEVARARPDTEGGAELRVGVGEYDQAGHAMMAHGLAELDAVVTEVRLFRNQAARPHPINRAARERWLRRLVVDQPHLVGASALQTVDDVSSRGGVRETHPAAARGTLADGSSVLVVCSIGLDLRLVPTAAEHLAVEAADSVVLALPERDIQPVMERTAALLATPCQLLAVPAPWPS